MARKKFFSPRDIDSLIPKLEKIFAHIDACRRRAEEVGQSASPLRAQATAAEIARNQLVRSQVQFLMEAVQDDVTHILRLGGVAKDLEAGLVDFPGKLDGEEVWLCWKRGERRLRFWHSLDQGFGGRQTLPQDGPTVFH